jgi:hypothetical protein
METPMEEEQPHNPRSIHDGSWYWINKTVLQDHGRDIGAVGIAVYSCLAFFADSRQTCFPSQQYIAELLGCSRATVNRAIKDLEARRLIRLERRGRCPQVYRLLSVRCNSGKSLLSNTRAFDVTPEGTNNTEITRINNNNPAASEDIHSSNLRTDHNPQPVIQNELFALELANALDDRQSLPQYLSYCRTYPESLLRRAIRDTTGVPDCRIKKSRAALFKYLVQEYAKHETNNSRH